MAIVTLPEIINALSSIFFQFNDFLVLWYWLLLLSPPCCFWAFHQVELLHWELNIPNLNFCTTALTSTPVMKGATYERSAVTTILAEHVAKITACFLCHMLHQYSCYCTSFLCWSTW